MSAPLLDAVDVLLAFVSMYGPFLLGPVSVLLFGSYAPVFVLKVARTPRRALARLAWTISLSALVSLPLGILINAFIPYPTSNYPRMPWVVFAFQGPQSILLALSLRFATQTWRLASAPCIATIVSLGSFYLAWGLWGSMSAAELDRLGFLLPPLTWSGACAILLYVLARRRGRRATTHRATICCSACGYPLTGLISPDRCPECGAGFDADPRAGVSGI